MNLSIYAKSQYKEPQYLRVGITSLCVASLRSWRYCVGARLKFWRRSRVPKKGSRDEAVEILFG